MKKMESRCGVCSCEYDTDFIPKVRVLSCGCDMCASCAHQSTVTHGHGLLGIDRAIKTFHPDTCKSANMKKNFVFTPCIRDDSNEASTLDQVITNILFGLLPRSPSVKRKISIGVTKKKQHEKKKLVCRKSNRNKNAEPERMEENITTTKTTSA